MLGWKKLDDIALLPVIRDDSFERPQVIFKHSTRCSVSSGALSRMNRNEDPAGADIYLLDLISYRDISNTLAAHYDIRHESPQLLLVWLGKVVYHESHSAISYEKLEQQLQQVRQEQENN